MFVEILLTTSVLAPCVAGGPDIRLRASCAGFTGIFSAKRLTGGAVGLILYRKGSIEAKA